MNIYFTEIAKEMSRIPTDYEFQKLAVQRELMTSKKELARFNRVQAGAAGEDRFYEIMNEFGSEHWYLLRNSWFSDYTDFECDFILITRHCVYVFEVKNYFGRFVYHNGQCSSRGVDITYNPINQARNAAVHMRQLTQKLSIDIPVKGVLVFIGEHNDVYIGDEIDYIDIISSNQVYQYIQKIITEEAHSPHRINAQKLISYYEQFEILKPYLPIPFSKEEVRKYGKAGTTCARCGNFNVNKVRSYIVCDCGYRESREEAIVRTACEYGTLTYGENFTVNDIKHFLANQASFQYLKKTLSQHFPIVPNEKVLTFLNYNRDYPYINEKFDFKLPAMLFF